MAEHDYVIANQNGANTRSDLNNALAAIVSNNSKATEPTTTYAFMWWADTANDLLKQRNAADSAWISILTLSTGTPSVATGASALGELSDATTTATSNLGLGTGAVDSITTGDYNVGVGDSALTAVTTGARNVAVGYQALQSNTSGNQNTAIGRHSLLDNISGNYCTAIGDSSLANNNTGMNNSAIGFESGMYNTSGGNNTFLGWKAGQSNTIGNNRVCVGLQAGQSNTSGSENIAVGVSSLQANTTGSQNIALGHEAMNLNTTGQFNTSTGNYSLKSNTTGTYNTAIGYQAGYNVTTGSNNVFVGRKAGFYGTSQITGDTSTFLGSYSYPLDSNAGSCVVVGHAVGGADGYTTIGHGSNDIRTPHGNVSWATVSDERYKKDIVDSTAGLSLVNALQPRTFKYKTLGELPTTFSAYEADSTEVFKNSDTNHGFIAQEVKAAIDADAGVKDGFRLWDDRPDGSQEVAETALIPVLVKAIQELSAKVEALENA